MAPLLKRMSQIVPVCPVGASQRRTARRIRTLRARPHYVRMRGSTARRGGAQHSGRMLRHYPRTHKELCALAGKAAVRPLPGSDHSTVITGWEPLVISPEINFVNIGERANVAGSAKFARLIREGLSQMP